MSSQSFKVRVPIVLREIIPDFAFTKQPIVEVRLPLAYLIDSDRWNNYLRLLSPDEHDEKLRALERAAMDEEG